MKKPTVIFLTGFSTAGKSTIGPILANTLGFSFIDIDKEISEMEKKSINDIFTEKGEAYFRKLEYDIVSKIATSNQDKVVIALGGGTLENDQSFEVIEKSGMLVYLKTHPKTLTKRLSNKDDRPLIKAENGSRLSIDEINHRVESMLLKRESRYSLADISIHTDETHLGKTIETLTRKIEKYIRSKESQTEEGPFDGSFKD